MPPQVIQSGEVFFLDVTVFNESSCAWVTLGDKPVGLSYHWQDLFGSSVIYDGERSLIGVDEIMPGESIQTRMKVVAPTVSNELQLVVTIIQDGVCWFEDRGFKPEVMKIPIMDQGR